MAPFWRISRHFLADVMVHVVTADFQDGSNPPAAAARARGFVGQKGLGVILDAVHMVLKPELEHRHVPQNVTSDLRR